MLVQYLAATLKQQLDASSFSFLSKVALLVIRQSPSLGFDAICKKKDGNALAAICDGCEKPISGPCYGCCTYCEFYLHYECARLPRQIEHFFHPRPLVLKLYYYTLRFEVDAEHVEKIAYIPVFAVTDHATSFYTHPALNYHKRSIIPFISGTLSISHFFGSSSSIIVLVLHAANDTTRFCWPIAASGVILPFIKIVLSSHHHSIMEITYTLSLSVTKGLPLSTATFVARKPKKFFLRCAVCGFNIHPYCLPSVPKTIRHKCHIDSLTLTKSPLEFELNSPEVANNSDDKFYCDVCEEKRDRRDPVYHCTECKFSAKVGCVISELIPSYITPGDQNAESSQVISMDEENSATNHTLETLNNVIAEPSAKPKLLMEERGPLKVEIEPLKLKLGQLEARLQEIEAELNQTTKRLDNLEVHRFLCMYQPRHSMKENYGFD
ncbi:hypothetical protein POUND7_004717 [Theobroma cacao]